MKKRVQFCSSIGMQVWYLIPTIVIYDYANQYNIQLCFLVFAIEMIIIKKGW